MKPTRPLVIGVAGIMGAGKSTVVRVFEDMGAAVVDADAMGKEMLAEPGMGKALVAAFGQGIADGQGRIDAGALGRVAFGSPANASRLDGITRDALIARIKARIEELRASAEVIVIDAALLPEWEAKPWLDLLIVVDCDEDEASARLARNARFGADEVKARMKHQMSRSEKVRCADIVLRNSGTLDDLRAEARRVFQAVIRTKGRTGRE
jgi:dephospho-CoA kinase